MIAILTDKPSVGKVIGRAIGATKVRNGYMEGNGYMVTWTFGNMISLAMPKDYGMERMERKDFPFIPSEFRLTVRHVRTETGWIPDIEAVLQLKTIRKVLEMCDTIISAMEAGRDGEMAFRYIYQHLGCTQPCLRLWISSLTDEAVRKGMENLEPDSLYDGLFLSADSRNKADWLLGVNASYAICKATGLGNNSLGRVQTPVLAAISRRYRERENHISTDTWPIYINLQKDNVLFKMRCAEDYSDKEIASMFYQDCKLAGTARITKVARHEQEIQPPALFNFTDLQIYAGKHHGMTAMEVYDITQVLYEKKLITYPRTASRHIPQDVYEYLPAILARLSAWKLFPATEFPVSPDLQPGRTVNESERRNHHAIIITGIRPEGLKEKEMQVYRLIAGRMLEAFMPPCLMETVTVEAICAAQVFTTVNNRIIHKGWKGVLRNTTSTKEGNITDNLPELKEGELIKISGCNLVHKKQLPVCPFTDAELLEYMEQYNLGTVTSRTSIIRTLLERKYIRYSGKYIVPTPKGMFTYETIRNKKIADASLTGDWEADFSSLERGEILQGDFLQKVKLLTKQITDDIFDTYIPCN